MDRELLLELGCEELPASWLPGLTNQIGDALVAQLTEHRLPPEAPAETFSTPRRLTVRVAHIPERQTDLEELLNGPPVSAGFKPDGTSTPAAAGFASKQGAEVSALERVRTPKGEYLAYRKRQRGKAAVDVLPAVLGGTLRALSFPRLMRWDATLDDGRGELLFGRPIRWILFVLRRPRRAVHDWAHLRRRDVSGPGGQHRRGDLRAPLSDDERPRGARDQSAHLRRVSREAARELRHPGAKRAAQQDRARARLESAAAAGPCQPRRAGRDRAPARSAPTWSSIRRWSPAPSPTNFSSFPKKC